MTVLVIALVIMAATQVLLHQIRQEAVYDTRVIQENALQTFWALLGTKGNEFRIKEGKLLVGEYVINGNNELPDRITQIFGGTATVFMGDTRIATNVLLENGQRAIGTKLAGPAYDAVFKEGKSYRGSAPILGIPYFTAYDPIRDKNGTIIGVLYVGIKVSDYLARYDSINNRIRGVTIVLALIFVTLALLLLQERKRSEFANRKQLQFLQVVIDTIPNPIFYKDRQGRYLGCNRAFEDYLGMGKAELIGKSVHDLAPKELADIYHQADQELFQGQGVQVYESSVVYHDGSPREVIFSKATFTGVNGEPGGIVGTFIDISDRKKAENALLEQKRFIDNLLQNSTIATFVLDARHQVIIWNKACEELTGLRSNEVVGTDLHWRAFYRDRRPCLADLIINGEQDQCRTMYKSCEPSSLSPGGLKSEGWHLSLNGGRFYILYHAAPIYNESGELSAVIQTLDDITSRKAAEELLQKQQNLLGNIIANIPHAVFWKDRDSVYMGCNANFARDAGLVSPDEIIGKTDHALAWSTEETAFNIMCDRRVMEREAPLLNYEESQHRSDGSIATLLTSKVPLRDESGAVIGMLGIYSDITEKSAADEEIKLALSLLNATFEATADGILVFDGNGVASNFNKKFADMWGIAKTLQNDSEPGMIVEQLLAQLRDPDTFSARLQELNARSQQESFQLLECRDGRQVECYSKPQYLDDEIVGRVWSFHDVSERRNLEQQLRHSQKIDALGTLTGGVAHDFNNILTAIIGYTTLVKDGHQDGATKRHYLEEVLGAAEKAARLTSSLLAYSRKVSQIMEPVDINNIVRSTSKMLTRIIGENIQLTCDLATEPLVVMADSGQIDQVLINLATNARDAMETQGELHITTALQDLDYDFIRVYGYGKQGKYVRITVADTGKGIEDDYIDQIFEPFFTTKEVGKGTGLGLSIIYGIIKQHEGYITVTSEVAKGTTFNIYLPQAQLSVNDSKGTTLPGTIRGGHETILLVEDEKEVRELYRSVMESAGYRIIEAVDGADAIVRYKEHMESIDLVILDVIMPKMNGKEAFDEIRKHNKNVKGLFASGYPADILSKTGIIESRLNFISKPFTPSKLLTKIRTILDTNFTGLQS
jgi:two-component system NtrC family sensor kinase